MEIKKGWYPDISNEDYHSGDEYGDFISSSNLKTFMRSPAHYRVSKDEHKEPTPAMNFGSAFHSIALGFPDEVAIIPDINKRTKAGKEEWLLFQESNSDKYLIKTEEMTQINGMVESIKHHKFARKLLESKTAQNEVSGFFVDHGTDLPCKIRPDILDRDMAIISDLKSCVDASFDEFSKTVFNFGYHYSAAWYRYGFQMIEGYDCAFVLIAVEKTPPYGVNTYPMEGRAIKIAQEKIGGVMGPLADCFKKDKWPCYPQVFTGPDVPGWVKGA